MALDALVSGFWTGYSNAAKMRALQMDIKARERLAAYRKDMGVAMQTGNFQGARNLAMSMGDVQTAKMADGMFQRRKAQDFGRLALDNPDEARRQDPVMFEAWKSGRDTTAVKMARERAALAAQQAQTRIALETHEMQKRAGMTAAETSRLSSMAKMILSGTDSKDLRTMVPSLNRNVAANSGLIKRLYAIKGDRVPIGVEAVNGPDGPMVTFKIRNDRTQSIGPATDRQGSASDENVLAVPLRDVYARLQVLARTGTKPGKWKMETLLNPRDNRNYKVPIDEAGNPDWSRAQRAPDKPVNLQMQKIGKDEYALFNPVTGQRTPLPKARNAVATALAERIKFHTRVSDITGQMTPEDKLINMAGLLIGGDIATSTRIPQGMAVQIIDRLVAELRSKGASDAKAYFAAPTNRERQAALVSIYRRIVSIAGMGRGKGNAGQSNAGKAGTGKAVPGKKQAAAELEAIGSARAAPRPPTGKAPVLPEQDDDSFIVIPPPTGSTADPATRAQRLRQGRYGPQLQIGAY
ncbi:MAG: hypothetical protein F4092_01485 [Rhodospirillaceae bacterium]|nr:hypothetical protein [Rhodospirillaceae bacterium]